MIVVRDIIAKEVRPHSLFPVIRSYKNLLSEVSLSIRTREVSFILLSLEVLNQLLLKIFDERLDG